MSESSVLLEKASVFIRVCRSADALPVRVQELPLPGDLKDFRYHKISAECLADQFEHQYLVIQHKTTGQTALQPVFLSRQDLLDGLPAMLRRLLAAPRKLFPHWLKARMLFVGCSAGAGTLTCAEPWAVRSLHEGLSALARKNGAAMILLKDFPAKYRSPLQLFLGAGGYQRVPSLPGCTLDLDFASFEEYMSKRLGRKLRYKYLKLNKQPPVPWEVLTDVSAIADELHALYLQTHLRSKMRFERLTPEFFRRVGLEMPDRARFFIWRVNGKIAAFALCLVQDGVMEHLNIGFDYAVALERQLYYVTIRDLFRWAISQNIRRYETGQLNYDPKLHLQMKLAPLDLYACHVSPWINPCFKFALRFLQPARHEPILQQFPNADEL